ncbi:MAG TPA: 4-carboxymuconolactone decarboxylase [Polyangiaceae bacterium]|nr:4-carboxymuconolactone decarboxylase [Polyangiaceae bacterium]
MVERRPQPGQPERPASVAPDAPERTDTEPPTDRTSDEPSDELYERGLGVRRAVLGSAHVERALGAATELDRDFQAYITRAAWGEIWARPGLSRHTRHLLTIGMLAALGRQEELALHLRSIDNTGVTLAEVKEILMQVAVYAGVPAANAAFATARSVLGDRHAERPTEKGA